MSVPGGTLGFLAAATIASSALVEWVTKLKDVEYVGTAIKATSPEWQHVVVPAVLVAAVLLTRDRRARAGLWTGMFAVLLLGTAYLFQRWRSQVAAGPPPVLLGELSLGAVADGLGAGGYVFLAGLALLAGAAAMAAPPKSRWRPLVVGIACVSVVLAFAHVSYYFMRKAPAPAIDVQVSAPVKTQAGQTARMVVVRITDGSPTPAIVQVERADRKSPQRYVLTMSRVVHVPASSGAGPIERRVQVLDREEAAGAGQARRAMPWAMGTAVLRGGQPQQPGFDCPAVVTRKSPWEFRQMAWPIVETDASGQPIGDCVAGQWEVELRPTESGASIVQQFDVPPVANPAVVAMTLLKESRDLMLSDRAEEARAKLQQLRQDYADTEAGRTAALYFQFDAAARAGDWDSLNSMANSATMFRQGTDETTSFLATAVGSARVTAAEALHSAGRDEEAVRALLEVQPGGLPPAERERYGRVAVEAGERAAGGQSAAEVRKLLDQALLASPTMARDAHFAFVKSVLCAAPDATGLADIEEFTSSFAQSPYAPAALVAAGKRYVKLLASPGGASDQGYKSRARQDFADALASAPDAEMRDAAEVGLLEVDCLTGDAWRALSELYARPRTAPAHEAIQLAREHLGLGLSMGDALDRQEVELTLQARVQEVDDPARLPDLTTENARSSVIYLKASPDQRSVSAQTALRDFVGNGGVLWIDGPAAALFGMSGLQLPGANTDVECVPAPASSADVADLLQGVSSVYVRGGYVVTAVAENSRPLFQPVLLTRGGAAACGLMQARKGVCVFRPADIDRTRGDGSRFVFNLKRYSLARASQSAQQPVP